MYWLNFAKNRWRRKKRRITKHGIRKTEIKLAKRIRAYLQSTEEERKKENGIIGGLMCATLLDLLSRKLRLDMSWDNKERWLDGVINGRAEIPESYMLILRGEIVWGLYKDIGGTQWREPFIAKIKIAKTKDKIISYVLKFADDEPLSNKILKTGMYPTIISEGWEKIFGNLNGSHGAIEVDFEKKLLKDLFKYTFTKRSSHN